MLTGIKVVDFSRYLPGPYASLRLADMGAEVIKVESPGGGDPARALGKRINGAALLYLANNRNKKSVTINTKAAQGKQLAFKLACQADVVIESFRPGVADAQGIGYAAVQKQKPDIIYCSLTGFGQKGLLSKLGSHDLNYIAQSGILAQLKNGQGRPVQPSFQFADMIGGLGASEAILAALVQRSISGKGAFIDFAMADTLIGMMSVHTLVHAQTGEGKGITEIAGKAICYYIYETADGRFVALGALERKFWENFCLALGKESWVADHLTPTTEENPTFNEVKQVFKSKSLAEWDQFSRQVDCCMSVILESEDLVHSPYIQEKMLALNMETDNWGNLLQLASSAGGYRPGSLASATPPPCLGQHNLEIFRDWLGYSEDDLAQWYKDGII